MCRAGFRLARLAVDRRLQGEGIGGQLLLAVPLLDAPLSLLLPLATIETALKKARKYWYRVGLISWEK